MLAGIARRGVRTRELSLTRTLYKADPNGAAPKRACATILSPSRRETLEECDARKKPESNRSSLDRGRYERYCRL